jgi:methionyl-tRNA formyltransferase
VKKFKAIFMGTPEFARAHLKSVYDSGHYDVLAVVTQPDRPSGRKMQLQKSRVKIFSEEKGIKVFSPESIKSEEFKKEIIELKPDIIIVVAYGQIIPRDFIAQFKDRIVNVHASLLPRWRGAAPVQRALMAGDQVTGVSLQNMVFELDAGDIIAEEKLNLEDDMNAVFLFNELPKLGSKLLTNDLVAYLKGDIKPTPQDNNFVTLAPKIAKEEALIDWRKPALDIHNQVRGLAAGPQAYTVSNGVKIKIHKTKYIKDLNGRPGEVQSVSNDSIAVACGQGGVCVLEVQPESRTRMSIESYLAGHDLKKGEILG